MEIEQSVVLVTGSGPLRIFQTLALAGYRAVRRSGFVSTRFGEASFVFFYHLYKEVFEGREVARLCKLVAPGSLVIDVGANIGYFTVLLAQRVGSAGRVIAFEPEPRNFARLQAAVTRAGVATWVDLVQTAVAEKSGQMSLVVNLDNPADHRLGNGDLPVAVRSLDEELAARGWPSVSLIKIDVQGAESRVLAGAKEVLKRLHPALYLEVDIATSDDDGASIIQVVTDLADCGYTAYRLASSQQGGPLTKDAVIALARRQGYADFLFLAEGDNRAAGLGG